MTIPVLPALNWQMDASWEAVLLYGLIGYLSGSFLSAYYIPLWLRHIDVTEDTPDHNPGAANAFQKAGVPCGVLVLACELVKGMLPVMLARDRIPVYSPGFALIMLAPVVGHGWSCFYKGGGKAIAVTFGVLLGLLPEARPLVLLCFFYILFSTVLRIRSHRQRSFATFFFWSLSVFLLVRIPPVAAGCAGIAAVLLYKHRRPDGEGSRGRRRIRKRV